jgi:hypothetical protein
VKTPLATPPQTKTSPVVLGRCPTDVLPLPAEAVARAADQARIQTPALYQGFGPAAVQCAQPASICAVAKLARPTQ